jgi:hypothetical protein
VASASSTEDIVDRWNDGVDLSPRSNMLSEFQTASIRQGAVIFAAAPRLGYIFSRYMVVVCIRWNEMNWD